MSLPRLRARLARPFLGLFLAVFAAIGGAVGVWATLVSGPGNDFGIAAAAMTAALFTLGALCGILYLLRARVLRPLRTMLSAAERLRAGDLAVRVPIERNDEIGRLARELNYMAESLEQAQATLEDKVARRTHELEQLQEQLVHSEKMSAVGRLVSGVAHELNNPLTAIMGFTELIRASVEQQMPDWPEKNKLQIIEEQTRRCRRIVSNLLQFARAQDSRIEPFELGEVIRHTVGLRDYELNTRGIRVDWSTGTEPAWIIGDRMKFQQVVLNLLNNAVDAILGQGDAGVVWIRAGIEGDRALLEVRDNGGGLADPQRVFDPFYSTKEVGKGAGLGLSACYGIVQELGGEIDAGNWELGARFRIRLPLAPPKTTAAAGEPALAAGGGAKGGTVLVVDDEIALVRLQVSFLSRLGLNAEGVLSGARAIEHLDRESVDLIIADARMPGAIDGLELYDWICKHRPDLAPRFLLTSGDELALEAQREAHPDVDCIAKPFDFSEYSSAVRRALEVGTPRS